MANSREAIRVFGANRTVSRETHGPVQKNSVRQRAASRGERALRRHVRRVNFARKIFFRATNFLTKNAPKFPRNF